MTMPKIILGSAIGCFAAMAAMGGLGVVLAKKLGANGMDIAQLVSESPEDFFAQQPADWLEPDVKDDDDTAPVDTGDVDGA